MHSEISKEKQKTLLSDFYWSSDHILLLDWYNISQEDFKETPTKLTLTSMCNSHKCCIITKKKAIHS